MENKINIAEILKDCPQGMELYSPIFGKVYLDKVRRYLAIIVTTDRKQGDSKEEFLYDGRYGMNGECMLFPSKGKTTWDGFVPPCQFKDGDVVVAEDNESFQLFLLKHLIHSKDDNTYDGYCYFGWDFQCNELFEKGNWGFNRLATEEEKAKLFKVIKDNGYHWNDETTTLEKLVESKEDTDVKIVMSGIYFDREYFADEVELQLGNYKIEVRDGKTYAVYKNQETKISKPIFKIGDKIKHKDTVLTIVNVLTNSYVVEDEPDNFGILMFSQQDKWELINEQKFKFKVDDKVKLKGGDEFGIITQVSDCFYTIKCKNNTHCWSIQKQDDWELINEPKFKVGDKIIRRKGYFVNPIEITAVTPKMYTFRDGSFQYVEIIDKDYELVSRKFDISSLKPFDKVLVRDTKDQVWVADLFSHMVKRPLGGYTIACVGHYPNQCIPYKDNEHLLGTNNKPDNFYKIWE